MEKVIKLIAYIIPIAIVLALIFSQKSCEESDKLERKNEALEYPNIESLGEHISGYVYYRRFSRKRNGGLLVLLSNGQKFTFSATSRNYDYFEKELVYFLQEGDSIIKPENSDSLYIIRENKTYYFRFNQILNRYK